MTILAGDIGGTKTNLALFDAELRCERSKSFPSGSYPGLGEVVREFLSERQAGSDIAAGRDSAPLAARAARIDGAAFGVAGPVMNGRSKTTNLPWVVDAAELAAQLGLAWAGLINDLEANAWGIAALAPGDFVTLNEGAKDARGNQAVIAAGTGLGEAGLYWDGTGHRPFACEGGHAGFSPSNDLEIELLRHLRTRFDHVSWERVVSGPGLYSVYAFLRDTGRGSESPAITQRLKTEDPSAVVSSSALDGSDDLAARALDLFVRLYGSEAGNLGLKMMATGGLFVGGGVAPKIIAKLKSGGFLEAFLPKGPMRPLLEGMPVRVIMNDRTALIGAARYAALHTARA